MEYLAIGIVGWASGIITVMGLALVYLPGKPPAAKRQRRIGFLNERG